MASDTAKSGRSGSGNYGSYTGSTGRVNLNTLPGYAQRDYNTAAAAAMGKSGQAKASAQQAKSQAAQFRAHANEHQMLQKHQKGKWFTAASNMELTPRILMMAQFVDRMLMEIILLQAMISFLLKIMKHLVQQLMHILLHRMKKVLAQGQAMECDRTADQYTQQSVDYSAAAGRYRAEQAQYDSSMDAQRQAIIEKYANINNMSSPTFSNIS